MAAPPLKISCHAISYGPQSPADSGNHLQKSNSTKPDQFQTGDEKRPSPSPTSPEVSSRWPRPLAVASRSATLAQRRPAPVTGTLQVHGEVAGTSARLQPAEILVHWTKSPLLISSGMITGNDYGVAGLSLSTAAPASANRNLANGFHLAHGNFPCTLAPRNSSLDLTERGDNPA